MATSRREKTLARITAILIALAIVFGGVVKPQLKQRRQLMQRKGELEKEAFLTQENLHLRNSVEKIHGVLVESLIISGGTESQEIAQLFRELRQLYEKQDLTPKSQSKLPTLFEPSYTVLSVKIELQGNINRIMRFIRSIAEAEAPLGIAKCEIQAQDQRDTVKAFFTVNKIVSKMAAKS